MSRQVRQGIARRELLRMAATATAGIGLVRSRRVLGGEERAKPAATTSAPTQEGQAGVIVGRVLYEGMPPAPEVIDCSTDPYCAKRYKDKPLTGEALVVSKDGRLQNVFVSVKSGLPKDTKWPMPAEPVVLSENCRFEPHVFGVTAGQPLDLLNTSRTHEVPHGYPKHNEEFSFSLPKKGMKARVILTRPETLAIKCDVHPWELAWCHVMAHSFFAVTDARGEFAIKGLPPGEYELEFWHERLGLHVSKARLGADKPCRVDDVKLKPGKKRGPEESKL